MLAQKGFSAETIAQLKLDGKLGFLTGQNAPLVRRVYEKYNTKADVDLVSSGLYKADEWKTIIGSDIPEGITADEYANHLANEVKISYPTAVAGEMIKRKEINPGDNAPTEELVKFFNGNEAKNNIGSQPIKTWDGFKELSAPAKASAKSMERMYQLTPSDESMIALSKTALSSAYQIAKLSKTEFMMAHGSKFPSSAEAEMTYTKAAEVYSASLGIATSYITSQTMANVYSITGKLAKEQNATIAYPTLEELLGNMDYCACDHCKSVLSPAAYMVELLQFLDLGDVPHDKANPIDELLSRRPDIQHIQLSCENTNMALPYIDLVNEILEYYLIHGNLTDLKGHDITEEITQSALLAEPQFVDKTAYDELKKKVFPYNLPFHQPLETLRRLFNVWEVSLEKMLSEFSTALSSRKETLGFSEDEYKTITDINFKALPEYFGEPAANTIAQLNTAIANGKIFSRRVGISYEDLVKLLKTNFINPGYSIVPLFEKLHVSLVDLNKYYTGALTDAQMDDLIPDDTLPADYGGDVKQWLKNNKELIMGLITLTDVGPESSECNFAQVELRYALPDNTNNTLTAVAYHKFHRFLRLLRKTGWKIETLDNIIYVLLPVASQQVTDANLDAVFIGLFDRIANFKKIADHLSYSEKKFENLLLVLDTNAALALRVEQCAKMLKLSLPDMAELSAFTGIDPLANDMEADEPSLLKFMLIARKLKEASLKIVDLAYLLHHVDLTGKLSPLNEVLLKNIKILRDTITAIDKENSITPDNADFNFAKGKMLQVYDAGTTDLFFGLLMGTNTYAAALNTIEEALPVKIAMVDAQLGFDPFKKQLTHSGIVSTAIKTLLENAADALALSDMTVITTQPDLNTYIADFKTSLGLLFTDSNADLTNFGANFPELKTIFDTVVTETTPAAQTKKLVDLLLPELKVRLKHNGLRQALISILKSDPDTVNVLTAKKENIQSAANAAQPVLFDFTQLEEHLIFDQNTTYRFYIDVPATDDYLLYVSAPQNTVVTLIIDAQTVINNITIGVANEINNATPLLLKTGELHKAEMTITSLPAAQKATVSWRTKGMEKSVIPATSVYAQEKVEFAKTSLIRLSKAAQLQNLFKFTPAELEYFASQNTETSNFLNNLDTNGTISKPNLVAQWNKIKLLADFNIIKEATEPDENTWLQVLKDPSAKNNLNKFLLEYFNMWDEADLAAVLTHFGLTRSDLSKLSVVKKVYDAMTLLSNIYYPAATVLTWITNDPSYDLAAGVKATIKQKVTEAAWLESMETVSDPVRNLLRDALVSYILQYKKPSVEITNPDKLYEYFLVDVEMDACMKTSRIRLALSTLQLFVQRCLMNLEPNVDAASIRADHWAWMKRYRVWEANRKVFLYPENWIEPELRDNKSSLFKELEGELLQSEITDESAELAFLNYLKKLDDIAKLDIVGMYLEENEKKNQDDDILHVFGRTNGNTRQYYYRRYEYGYWTPWEKVSLAVEGDHIFPIVWRKKLFLFWLNIFEKPVEVNNSSTPTDISKAAWGNQKRINVEVNMCWGEYFKGKWTSPKSTELKKPVIINNLSYFEPQTLLIYGRKESVENPPGKFRERLVFYLRYRGGGGGNNRNAVLTFTSKNAPPYIEYKDDTELYQKVRENLNTTFFSPYADSSDKTNLYFSQFFNPGKVFKVNIKQPFGATKNEITETVLTKKDKLTTSFAVLPTWHPVENQFEAPLSYADEHSTLFVKPDEELYTPLRLYEEYYPVYEAPFLYEEIPLLVDKPIKGWPPEEMVDPAEEVILTDKWTWNKEAIRTNANYNKMLPVNDTFNYEGTIFDTAGKNINAGKANF
ncbi:MAG TPA: neuraminidase-like domain-containing protein [Agriterribacter sp.]|nr:neuraminidase-like domain-containing protein [Agriterribacter sp.]